MEAQKTNRTHAARYLMYASGLAPRSKLLNENPSISDAVGKSGRFRFFFWIWASCVGSVVNQYPYFSAVQACKPTKRVRLSLLGQCLNKYCRKNILGIHPYARPPNMFFCSWFLGVKYSGNFVPRWWHCSGHLEQWNSQTWTEEGESFNMLHFKNGMRPYKRGGPILQWYCW